MVTVTYKKQNVKNEASQRDLEKSTSGWLKFVDIHQYWALLLGKTYRLFIPSIKSMKQATTKYCTFWETQRALKKQLLNGSTQK